MRFKLFFCFLFTVFCTAVFAQTHTSVPLDNQIYLILEQAQLRGLCAPLPGVRPYTQAVVVSAIREILESEESEKLASVERAILERYLGKFSKPNTGFDPKRGAYYNETFLSGDRIIVSANVGTGANIEGSTGIYSYTSNNENPFGLEIWLQAYLNGDISSHISYSFDFAGGLMQAPLKYLGEYDTYYKGFIYNADNLDDPSNKEFVNETIKVYSEPLTHFPYSYRKRWDGSVFFLDSLSNFDYWPGTMAGGYGMSSEVTASFFENKLILRLGRLSHEWGSAPFGSSLSFNQAARPFFGFEYEFSPVSWFTIASLTGSLEYYNTEGIKISSATFQNLFSATMLQFRYKNIIFFDVMDAVVYPKRLELGYMSPITNSFFYQNNIGDFDNLAMSFNLKAQIPTFGNIWISLFLDEMTLLSDLFELDRQMLALQAGTTLYLPFLAFSSIKLSYTVVNPYCYTHNRNFNPWYGDNRMETSYVNNGVSLGYYLPPNSDELLVRFETMPAKTINASLQYQLIRHGADFGSSAVDGSNLSSELDPLGRDSNSVLKRFFLQDGAYQWTHIIKLGAEWMPEKAPIALFCEVGAVISFFTNIDGTANSGNPQPYYRINTPEYPEYKAFIARIGFKLYPR